MRLHRMAGAIAAVLFILAGLIALRGFINLFRTPNRSQDTARTLRRIGGAIAAALLILAGLIALGGFSDLFGKPDHRQETTLSHAAASQDIRPEPSTAPAQSDWPPPWPAPTPTLEPTPEVPPSLPPDEPPPTVDGSAPDVETQPTAIDEPFVSAEPSEPDPVSANEPPAPVEYQDYDMANAVLRDISEARAAQGLGALSADAALTAAAESYAQYLADTDTFGHDGEGGMLARVRAAGYGGGYVGEALWEGWGAYAPDEIVNEWLNSPAHRGILLGAVYTDAGVACFVVESNSSTRCVLDVGAP